MLNENRDRHEHVGLGQIGEEGMSEIIRIMNKKNIPMILETPIDEKRDDFGNIEKVKSLV
jgi:deoxyribonuclease-4